MHKQESVLENEMNKIIWDFEIQTDHPTPARKEQITPARKLVRKNPAVMWKWKKAKR